MVVYCNTLVKLNKKRNYYFNFIIVYYADDNDDDDDLDHLSFHFFAWLTLTTTSSVLTAIQQYFFRRPGEREGRED